MEIITRYGDVGTPERHKKFAGVNVTVVDGQELGISGAADLPDALLFKGIFNQEQYINVIALIRDFQIGELYKWKTVREYFSAQGMSEEEAEIQRSEAKKNYNAALAFERNFKFLSELALYTTSSLEFEIKYQNMGNYTPSAKRLQYFADRLINFYCTHERIKVELNSSPK